MIIGNSIGQVLIAGNEDGFSIVVNSEATAETEGDTIL